MRCELFLSLLLSVSVSASVSLSLSVISQTENFNSFLEKSIFRGHMPGLAIFVYKFNNRYVVNATFLCFETSKLWVLICIFCRIDGKPKD